MNNPSSLSYNINDSCVLLVGVSKYQDKRINDLPNVNGNLNALKTFFSNPDFVGFPEESVHILNSPTSTDFLKTIHRLVKSTNDTLFLYYSGHGMYHNQTLYFTFSDTDLDYLITSAIEYERIEKILKDGLQLHKKVIIIDSCFSGKITEILSDYNSLLEAELQGLSGAYILASSPSNRASKSLPGKGITEFTESLVKVFTNGVDNKYPFIFDEILFSELDKDIRMKNELRNDIYRPKQLKTFNGPFYISRNPNYKDKFKTISTQTPENSLSSKITIKAFGDAIYNWLKSKDLSKKLEEQEKSFQETINKINIQRELLSVKNKDITDSIKYASRIQTTMLPSKDILSGNLKEWFIFFQPRDIVSGDFYWFKEVHNKLFIAVADATGHGVPGAFMSILGINLFNELTNTKRKLSTDYILNDLRKNVINNLNFDDSVVRDGFDAGLCCIDKNNNILEFSGANHSLYYFQNKELKFVKGERMPVGYYEEMHSFSKTTIQVHPGDTFYIFTDGYIDQFGGPEDKKFKLRRFKQLLVDVQDYDLNNQHEILKSTMDNWKGDGFQVDDMLIVGFKL